MSLLNIGVPGNNQTGWFLAASGEYHLMINGVVVVQVNATTFTTALDLALTDADLGLSGLTIADGGFIKPSYAVVAAAGTNAATATVLADEENAVTGADGTKGVALPAAAVGLRIRVINTVTTAFLQVYPVSGGNDNINGLAEDAAFSVGPGEEAIFIATSATQWYCREKAGRVPVESVAVVAAAGTNAATATVLADPRNAVTGADGVKGVALPAAAVGLVITVINASSRELKVYPLSGGNDNINDLAEDLAFTVGPNREAQFIATSATKWYTPEAADSSETFIVPIAGNAKVGATAGWVITGVDNVDHATLPASQTTATLVVGIPGLKVGDIVTAFGVYGQVESAGAEATLVASLRKTTGAAADITDAEIGTDTTGALVADTELTSANLGQALATAEVMAANEKIYLLLTGTTAAATDIDITHVTVTVTRVK